MYCCPDNLALFEMSHKKAGGPAVIDLRLLSYNLNSDDSFPCANLIEIGKIDMPKLPTRHLTVDNGNGLGSSHENGSEMRVRIE
jgi:hypothetical protein